MTLDEVYGRYTQEPFGLRPWEIARMTDWQLEWLYDRPAHREYRKAHNLPPEVPTTAVDGGPQTGSMPRDKEQFVKWWRAVNGGDRESALQRYAQEFPNGGE